MVKWNIKILIKIGNELNSIIESMLKFKNNQPNKFENVCLNYFL